MRGEIYLAGIMKMLGTSEMASEHRGGVYHTINIKPDRSRSWVKTLSVIINQSLFIYLIIRELFDYLIALI